MWSLDRSRARLAQWMATGVVRSCHPLDVFVACDSGDVANWAAEHGAAVIWGPGLGLNGAIDDGVAAIADAGYDQVIISHADLPHPTTLPTVARAASGHAGAGSAPRRHQRAVVPAQPMQSLPPTGPARSAGTFAAAQALGIAVEVRPDRDLSLDVDTPGDLAHPRIKEALPLWLRTNPANPT